MVQRCQLLQPDLTGTRRVLSTVQAAASAQLYRSNASEGRSSTARKQQNSTVSSCAKTGLTKSLDLPSQPWGHEGCGAAGDLCASRRPHTLDRITWVIGLELLQCFFDVCRGCERPTEARFCSPRVCYFHTPIVFIPFSKFSVRRETFPSRISLRNRVAPAKKSLA